MSTFVFAPSWVTYPNHPKTIKEEIDEFPTLISHNKKPSTANKNENNVWSNPTLIQRIHHSGDEEDEEDVDFEEKKYELERLKALVPKTKNSVSTSSSTWTPRRSIRLKPKTLNKPKEQMPVATVIDSAPKYYISEQEQQHFIYFIKTWTSTGITPNTNHYRDDNTRDYSYFSSISSNSSYTSKSSVSSFQSDTSLYSSNSYFHHDPF